MEPGGAAARAGLPAEGFARAALRAANAQHSATSAPPAAGRAGGGTALERLEALRKPKPRAKAKAGASVAPEAPGAGQGGAVGGDAVQRGDAAGAAGAARGALSALQARLRKLNTKIAESTSPAPPAPAPPAPAPPAPGCTVEPLKPPPPAEPPAPPSAARAHEAFVEGPPRQAGQLPPRLPAQPIKMTHVSTIPSAPPRPSARAPSGLARLREMQVMRRHRPGSRGGGARPMASDSGGDESDPLAGLLAAQKKAEDEERQVAERRACRRESTLSRAASLKAEAQARRARAASKQAAKEATEREANAVRPVIDEADGAPGEGDDRGEVTVDEIMNFKSPPPPEATAPRRTLLCIDDDVSGGNGGSVPPSPALLPIRELKRRLAARGVAQARVDACMEKAELVALLDESERGGAEVKVTPVESADATGAGVDAPLTPRAPEGPPLTARWQAGEGLAPARSSAPVAPPRAGAACVALGLRCWLIGGARGDEYLSDVWEFDSETHTFYERLCTGAAPRRLAYASASLAACADAGGGDGDEVATALVFGGWDGKTCRNALYSAQGWDAHPDDAVVWSLLRPVGAPPSPRAMHTACVVSDLLYVFGGWNAAQTAAYGGFLNDAFALDVAQLRWHALPRRGALPAARGSHSMVPLGRRLLVYGGTGAQGALSDAFLFDVDEFVWTRAPCARAARAPPARSGHTAAVIRGRHMLVVGGFDGKRPLNDAWRLDTRSWLWERIETAATEAIPMAPRSGHAGALVGARFLQLCGWSPAEKANFGALPDVHAVDLTEEALACARLGILGEGALADGGVARALADGEGVHNAAEMEVLLRGGRGGGCERQCQWFRAKPGGRAGGRQGVWEIIPAAAGERYRLSADDVGYRVGCSVGLADGQGQLLGLSYFACTASAVAVAPATLEAVQAALKAGESPPLAVSLILQTGDVRAGLSLTLSKSGVRLRQGVSGNTLLKDRWRDESGVALSGTRADALSLEVKAGVSLPLVVERGKRDECAMLVRAFWAMAMNG